MKDAIKEQREDLDSYINIRSTINTYLNQDSTKQILKNKVDTYSYNLP